MMVRNESIMVSLELDLNNMKTCLRVFSYRAQSPIIGQDLNFYRQHHKLDSKFNVGLNFFYVKAYRNQNCMVTKYTKLIKKIMGRTDFSDYFRKIIICHTRIGYNINVMR